MRLVPLDRPGKGHEPLWVFDFLILILNFEKTVQSSEPLHTKVHLILLLVGITGCMATNRNLFPPNRSPKMRESQQLSFGLRLLRRIFEETRNPNQNRAFIWKIFSSNKSRPANRKKGFYTNRNPNKQEVGFIFV
jgi:hypothetical protein